MINETFNDNFYSNLIDTFAEFNPIINDNITPEVALNNSSFSFNSPFSAIIGETGNATLDHNQKKIGFGSEYDNPVVLATSLSLRGGDPATVRITDISGSSFTAFVEEPNYLAPGGHVKESFSYVVIEAGTYMLPDGTLIEADTFESNATTYSKWESIEFDNHFDSAPAVFSQVQSHVGSDFVRTRMQDIDENGFKVSMEEEERLLSSGHYTETIGFLAISQGSGTWGNSLYQAGSTKNVINDSSHILQLDDFNQAPNFIADVATYHGGDPVGVRQKRLSNDRISIMLDEDSSLDSERYHVPEVVNFLAIEGNGFLTGAATDPVELSEIQLTSVDSNKKLHTGEIAKITWNNNISSKGEVSALSNDEQDEKVDIALFHDNELVQLVATKADNDGQTYWTIPNNLPESRSL